MQRVCVCPHCTADVEEAVWYFGLFCEYDVEEFRPIAAAPTLHLGLGIVARQEELDCLWHDGDEDIS